MNSITVTPIDMVQYGCFAFSALALGLWWWGWGCRGWGSRVSARTWIKVSGYSGLLFLLIGCLVWPLKYNLQGHAAHKAAFAKLPIEWQDFYNRLNEMDRVLHSRAIKSFVHSDPPQLTVENHAALTGFHLWLSGGARDNGETIAMRSLQRSTHLEGIVEFDFAEGKK